MTDHLERVLAALTIPADRREIADAAARRHPYPVWLAPPEIRDSVLTV